MADRNGYIGRAPGDSSVTVARQSFTSTGITTDFTFAAGYTPGYFDLFINGVKMIEGSDFTSSDGSTFSVLILFKYSLRTLISLFFASLDISLDNSSPSEVLVTLCVLNRGCLLYTSPSPRDGLLSRMPSSA